MTDLNKIINMIIKKIWIFVLITVVLVSVSTYLSLYKIKPKFEASTKLLVVLGSDDSKNEITYESLLSGPLLIKNYKDMIKSRAVTSEVIKKEPGIGLTDDELANDISVDLVPDSGLISISVVNENPYVAAEIANDVSSIFIQKASDILKIKDISMLDKAFAPDKPIYPQLWMVIAFSILASIMLSLGIILVIVYLDDTVGNPYEIEKKTGLLVVGIIPDMKIR